jgi:hypothetical protein
MELRIKAAVVLAALAMGAAAQPAGMSYEVRHKHLRKGGEGTLTFTADGVSFAERGKKSGHSRVWKYGEIQQLELGPEELRILTYEDSKWKLGQDREYVFDRLPEKMAEQLYPNLYAQMDQRFVARMADQFVEPLWEAPAKLLRGFGGVDGVLRAGPDRIVFEAGKPGESRTWRYGDVANISLAGPFDFTVTSLDGDVRFQLKRVLPEERFNDLWRRIHEANGLRTFQSQLEKN